MATDPQPGQRIPGTPYIVCDNKCTEQGAGNMFTCVPAPAPDNCSPNNNQKWRCHCLPFRRRFNTEEWEVVETDSMGRYAKDTSSYFYRCWCVRNPSVAPTSRRRKKASQSTARKAGSKKGPAAKRKAKTKTKTKRKAPARKQKRSVKRRKTKRSR